MPSLKLTDKALNRKPPAAGQTELWDKVVPGFGLRIFPSGRRSYFVMTRVLGRQIRRTLGTTDALKLAEARDKAREVLREAARGIDPKEMDRRARIEAERARRDTFRVVAEEYMQKRAADLRSRGEMQARLERDIFPSWGSRPIKEITRADVRALLNDKAEKHPVAANRMLALIRPVFNYALDEELIDASPMVRIRRPGEETARDRVLTDDEIRRLWGGFDKLGAPFGQLFKLLLLTGQRRNEVGGMKWPEIDGDVWILPGERTKNGQPNTVPLAPLAREILASIPKIADADGNTLAHVFTTARKGDRAPSGWGKIKVRLDRVIAEEAAEAAKQKLDMKKHALPSWRIHDIRRSVRTNLPRLGISPDTAERCLGHVIGGVRGVYDRYAYDKEKRHALEAWARHVKALVTGKLAARNVIELRKGGAA